VIERNSAVPISRVKRYFPITDRQAHLDLKVFQGEARLARDNILLGGLKIALPGGPREQGGVDVRFTYDVNGLLQVEATVLKTQHTSSLVIEGNPGILSEEEIAARLAALSELKIHPRDRIEHRTLLARAERLYQLLRGEQREWFGSQIVVFERTLEAQEDRLIARNRKEFEELLNHVEHQSFINPPSLEPT